MCLLQDTIIVIEMIRHEYDDITPFVFINLKKIS